MNEETCSYWPSTTSWWDDDDKEYEIYDLGGGDDGIYTCDKCNYDLLSEWFDYETGECYANYCPCCGRKIVQDLKKLQSKWRVEDE